MSYTTGFSIGDVVTNQDIMTSFKCANSGGIFLDLQIRLLSL